MSMRMPSPQHVRLSVQDKIWNGYQGVQACEAGVSMTGCTGERSILDAHAYKLAAGCPILAASAIYLIDAGSR